METPALPVAFGLGTLILILAVIAVRISRRFGLPSLLLYLGIGMILGNTGIHFSDTLLTEHLGLAALVFILIEGGLTTRWAAVRPALGLGISLATVAVVVSIGVAGLGVHLIMGYDWRIALTWAAVLSSTDVAAVFSVLRGLGVKARLTGALELESGLNDAPVVIAVVLFGGTAAITWAAPVVVVYELAAGAADRWRARLGGRLAVAARRAAGDRPVLAGHRGGGVRGLRRGRVRARLRVPGHLRGGADPGQQPTATAGVDAVVRAGPRLGGPDRAVRAARLVRRRHQAPGRADPAASSSG